jgi:hypothetical protein
VIGFGVLLVLGIGTMAGLIWLTSDLVQQVKRIDSDNREVIERSTSTLQRCTERLHKAL